MNYIQKFVFFPEPMMNADMMNATGISNIIVHDHKRLKQANLADEQCEKKMADVICKMPPACSKDQTKVIAFLSKQKWLDAAS